MTWLRLQMRTTITRMRIVRTMRAPVTTPIRVSTVTELGGSVPSWFAFSLDSRAEEEVMKVVSMVDMVVVVVVVVVVGKHSGGMGSPNNLLQLMNRWDPSVADIALMAFMLSSLLITSTCLVFLMVNEPVLSLRKIQSLMMTLLVLSMVTLDGGR